MKKGNRFTHYSSRPYLALFSIVSITAVLLISVIIYGIKTANELTATYRMQIQAAHMIKFETTRAHLWFEEIISGDEQESIDTVNQHIETSLWYARALLHGARNSKGEFPPVEDARLRKHLKKSMRKQEAYRDIISNRYRIFKEEGKAQVGSETDQKTDKFYKEFIQLTGMIESELNAVIEKRWSDFMKTEIALTAILLLACVLCTWVITKLFSQKDRIAATLKESRENLRITLESIGDGVIATDNKGFITMLNPVAEELTGWNRDEAVGQKMEEVFNIKSAVTGKKAENPVDRVIETGSIVGLANHTVLVSKQGSEHQIADSGAPIINKANSVTGVIVVFRDVTEEYEKDQRIKESEESLRLFFDNIPLAVFAHDMEGNFIFINSTSAEYTGYTEEELIDLNVSDIDAQSTSREDREKIWNRLRFGEKEYIETTHYRKDGSYYLAGVSIASIVYKGKPVLLAIAMDITEHRHAEAALRESQDMLAKTLEATNDGIWDWNLETDEVYFSPRYYKMAGYTPDEYPHRFDEFKKRVHSEDIDYVLNNAENHIKGEISRFIVEFRFRKKNGDWLWLMGRGKIVERDENGNPLRMIGTHTDITERKNAEYALVTEKERLAVTLKSIGDGVITTDINGCILIMNPVSERLTGWKQSEAEGKPLKEIFHIVNEKTGKRLKDPVDKVLRNNTVVSLENHTMLISKTGNQRIIADSGAPIKNTQDQTIGVVLVFRDITEKERLLESMQLTDKMDSLGVLAGGIAHDFNNLLSGLFGYIDMARELQNNNKKAEQYLDKALSVFNRAKSLTQQLLTFAKGGEPQKKTGDIAGLLKSNVAFSLSGSDITAEYHINEDLFTCDFDENQISQVIDNLTINAKQAMPKGGEIKVSAENTVIEDNKKSVLKPGRYVKISISDTGVGIPEDHLRSIFDPFFSTKNQGNGLGLATCYSIIEKHDGLIEADSEPGEGSVFTIYLPASEDPSSSETPLPVTEHKGAGNILIMDDEDFIREICGEMLRRMGYSVYEARNGEEAIKISSEHRLTCAILDLTVPGGMGGKETVTELRKSYPDIPVFASSGYSKDPVFSEPGTYGFTDSIRKPYRKRELSRLLQSHL